MKLLKFSCPFHGKYWPLIAALFAEVAAWGSTRNKEWPDELIHAVLLFAPLAVLVIAYLVIQRLSPAERELVAGTEYATWEPVTEDVIRKVREQKLHISKGVVSLLGYLGLFALAFLLPAQSGEPSFGLSAFCLLIGAVVFIADTLLRSKWQSVGINAVMAKVPIDHMFDIIRPVNRKWELYYGINDGPERITNYIVFYQPDGRYVVRAGDGSGNANTLIIVKYNGMLTWIPTYE